VRKKHQAFFSEGRGLSIISYLNSTVMRILFDVVMTREHCLDVAGYSAAQSHQAQSWPCLDANKAKGRIRQEKVVGH